MTHAVFSTLLRELIALPGETEWVEFKCNNEKPEDVGEHLSALANSVTLHRKQRGNMPDMCRSGRESYVTGRPPASAAQWRQVGQRPWNQ